MVSFRRTNTNTVPSPYPLVLSTRVCVMLSDDVDLNSVASIPGMGIPEQLKAAMEQEQSSKFQPGSNWTISYTILRGFHNTSS